LQANICPWLGTEEDRKTHHSEAVEAHLCYAQKGRPEVPLTYQARFCLTGEHQICQFYLEPPPPPSAPEPLTAEQDEVGPPPARLSTWQVLLWLGVILAVIVAAFYFGSNVLAPAPTATAAPSPTPSPLPTATPTPASVLIRPSPSAAPGSARHTATPTPYPGGAIYSLSPQADAAGWMAGDEARGNHLGDSYLYAGVFDGVAYHGAFQLDLSAVPRGAAIHAAVLELTGLDAGRLGTSGAWEVRVLPRQADEGWSRHTFQDLHNVVLQWTLTPALAASDLAAGGVNTFALSAEQLRDLEQRLLDEHYTVSFRIDGPLAGENSLFAWDSGAGPASQGHGPRLVLSVGPPPKTPIPTGSPVVVVVTSTPTPANVLTAEAHGMTATAIVTTLGRPTATSIYEWTATPIYVVTNTPTPANQATATMVMRLATAIAFTTGTPTPAPDYVVTATPTRVMIPFDELTPTPTPPPPTPAPRIPMQLQGLILFQSSRAGTAGPWAMNAEGLQVALLTAAWPYELAAGREAVSPDGTQLVYAGSVHGQPAILVRPAGGGQGAPVVVLEQGAVSSPVWSPTGNRIAFVLSGGGRTAIWLVSRDGGDLRQLTRPAGGSANHPTFSPDGARLAYTSVSAEGQRQVWSIALDGTGGRNLSNNGWNEWDPVWVK
jgi:WD40-like Beta Propeller Repeat